MTLAFSDIMSLLLYFSVLIIAAALIHLSQDGKFSIIQRRAVLISGLALPTILGGFRYSVGADYNSYNTKTEIATRMDIFEFYNSFNGIEPSVWILGNVSQHLLGNSVLFFTVTSFLVTIFLFLGVRNFGIKRVGLAMLLLLMVIFPQSLSGVRQGVAIALCFYAFSYILQGNLKKYFLIVCISGMLFHFSSFAMLLVYPLYWIIVKKSKSEKQFIKRTTYLAIFSPVVMVVGLFMIQFIPLLDKYAAYYTRFMDSFAHKIGTHNMLPELFALVFLIVLYKYIVKKSSLGQFALMCTVIMITLNLGGYIIPLIGRLGDYFMPIFLIALAGLPDIFKDNKYEKLAVVFVILWAAAFFIGAFYLNGSGSIFPYSLRISV